MFLLRKLDVTADNRVAIEHLIDPIPGQTRFRLSESTS